MWLLTGYYNRFIEFGKHRDHLYGIKAESIQEVMAENKMCILDVHPQVLLLGLLLGGGALIEEGRSL